MKKIIVLSAALIAALTACQPQSKKSEQTATEETPAKEKVTVVARVQVNPDQTAAFTNVAKTLVDATRTEPGNISYNVYQSPLDSCSFIFYEEYADENAFSAHAASAHFKSFADTIPVMLAEDLIIEQF